MKKPFISKENLLKIIEKYPTPFHLYSEQGIRATARELASAFAWNKGFREYFAVKATPNPAILKILKEEGCGVDCSSYNELVMSNVVGFTGGGIMFSSNDTPEEDFILASRLNSIINLDDITHINFLEKIAGIPETVCCRFNPGSSFTVNTNIMDNPGEAKYGFTREQLSEGFKLLLSKGAKRFGLHAFLASNTTNPEYYPLLAETLFKTAVELHDETGADFAFINLSGGLGIPYRPTDKAVNVNEVSQKIQNAYNKILTPAGLNNIAIFTELGRYMLAPHGCLVTTVKHEKNIHKNYIGVDACAANLMRPAMYGAYHHITVAGKENLPLDHVYDVTGSLCENNDKFAVNRELPKIDIGDILVIHDTGAHGFSMGYNYNGKLRSAEILLREDGTTEIIRRPETTADYFATFDFDSEFTSVLNNKYL